MQEADFVQTSFLGGEWGPFAQGRADRPDYRTSMSLCQNGLPLEEGCWVRRPGTQRVIPTYHRLIPRLLPFVPSPTAAYACEITTDGSNGRIRFFSGACPVFTNDARTVTVASYDTATLTLTLDAASGWAGGDLVMLFFPSTVTGTQEATCRGRVLQIITAPGNVLTLGDDRGYSLTIPFPLPSGALVGATVFRIATGVVSAWAGGVSKIRVVQAGTSAVFLSALAAPQTLTYTAPVGNGDPTFSIAATTFQDGPYNDTPQADTGTVSAYSGSITFTPASSTFSTADVGRMIRLWSQPAAWAAGTTYTNGQTVTYNNQFWRSIVGGSDTNVGVPPGSALTRVDGTQAQVWTPAPLEGQWAWGTITAQAGTNCTVSLQTPLNSSNGSTVSQWYLGLFKSGQYPIAGTYHGGRLWLIGAEASRFDGSMSNSPFTFSPTDVYGNVNDDSAIAYVLNSRELESLYWIVPDQQGLLAGSLTGEWQITASAGDVITPTSIDARKVTRYGSLEHEPVQTGMATCFIQRYGRTVQEYLADSFTAKYSGRPLNERAKHLMASGAAEIAYMQQSSPTIWVRTNVGQLIGCTYRRTKRFVSEEADFQAWHQHATGLGIEGFESMCIVPAVSGLDDRLYLAALDVYGDCYLEMLRPLPQVDDI